MRQTDYKVILMMESFIITPRAGAIVLWLGHIGALFQLCGIMETVMSKKDCPQFINFRTLGTKILLLGLSNIAHIVTNVSMMIQILEI